MNEFLNHPLLKRDNIHKVINDVEIGPKTYRGQEILPFNTTDSDVIKIDVQKLHGGMTQAVARGAESPVIERRGVRQFQFTPACFREKILLSAEDLNSIRKLGTTGDKEKAVAVIAKTVAILRDRVESRIEWSRWQAIQGSLAIDENGVIFTVDYQFPTANKPVLTGTNLWSDTTNSDPIDDIMDWIQLFRKTGMEFKKLWFNQKIEQYLFQNARIVALLNRTVNSGDRTLMSRKTLQNLFQTFIGDVNYEVYDKNTWLVAEVVSAISSGDSSAVVSEVANFASGDTITLTSFDGQTSEELTIDSASARTITFTGTTSNAYVIGAEIRAWKPFIPDTTVILEGTLPIGALGGRNIGEYISSWSEYGAGSITNPKPGIFAETQFHENEDPKYIAVIAGVYGLPVMYRNNGIIVATVA